MYTLNVLRKLFISSAVFLSSCGGIVSAQTLDEYGQEPSLSFFALSDIHMEEAGAQSQTYEGFQDALDDIVKINPNNNALVIPGDMTNYATEAQYQAFYDLLAAHPEVGQPMLALGNHDVRWLCTSANRNPASPDVPTCKPGTSPFADRYLQYNKKYMGNIPEGQLYFDQWVNGYHFITLNTEKDLKDRAYLSKEQLLWLDKKLAENADVNKPIFINLHQAFSDATYQPGNLDAHIGEQEDDLKDVLKKYPQIVMMTGHTHPSMASTDVYNTYYGHIIEIPGLYYNGGVGDTRGRIGYQVNVYDDHIQFRLRDFKNDVWLDEYEKNFKLTDMDKDNSDDSFDLRLDGMSATAGSQNSNAGVEGPASNVLDGDVNTKWHTKYGGTAIGDNWINIHLDEKQIVNGLRYLPRQDGGVNGTILEYEIYVSSDQGETYTKVSEGNFESNMNWQLALFDAVEVTDVKLQPTKTATTPTREYGSAAEIRLCNIIEGIVNKEKLNNLLLQCETINEKDYLNNNWGAYKIALERAQRAALDENISQAEINNVVKKLTSAISNLEKRPTAENPIISPINAKAGSSYGGNQLPINVVNGVGMTSGGLDGQHDNQSSAKTMWHTANNPGAKAWFEVDLGEVFALDEMWIWNINQMNNVTRGFRNVKIEYSLDEIDWKVLNPEEGLNFKEAVTEEYPFQFAKASGEALVGATNLNDDNNSPVSFNGKEARYVRITAAPMAGEGSWGQTYFGLSELRFTCDFSVDKTNLQNLYDECLILEEVNYTQESWIEFKTVLDNVRAILDKEDATQEEVDNALTALQEAKEALVEAEVVVSKTKLQIAVEMASAISEEDLDKVVPVVVEEFNGALDEAKTILANDNVTQAQVDASFVRLATAMHMLQFYKGDKAELKALINSANELVEENYTADSWTVLKDALDAANVVNDNENALQEEVDEAVNNLQAAIDGLEEVQVVDKTLLEAMVNKVTGLNESEYIPSTWQAMLPVLQEAKNVLIDEKVTQEQVDTSFEALTRAYLDLRLIPNKDLLQELINKANGLNAANYSAKTWSVVADALNEAVAVLNDPEVSQEKVNNAKDVLTEALAGLQTVNTVKSGNTTSIKTGDNGLIGIFASLSMLSVAGLSLLRKKED